MVYEKVDCHTDAELQLHSRQWHPPRVPYFFFMSTAQLSYRSCSFLSRLRRPRSLQILLSAALVTTVLVHELTQNSQWLLAEAM